jgi:threonylcarbamoyladenosine tRNA methylthiotransferase CDKAL1
VAKVHVEVYGCSSNQADAEIASGLLAEAGHTLVDSTDEADVSVILTCIVKTPTETKIVRRLGELCDRRVVVAGCMPKALRGLVEETLPGASMVGPDDLVRIPEAVECAALGKRAVYLEGSSPDRTCLPRERRSGLIHIAPIAAGCLGNCSYCIVKVARGRLYSFPSEKIVTDAEAAIASGCREIWVTAEDTAAYDNKGVKLPELINRLGAIDGKFMIRVGMTTPNSALPVFDDLVEAFRGEKVYRFLHIPIQSGSDEVLRRMRRKYTVAEFSELVTRFRKEIPDIGIATDIICGFPGETEEQFGESLRLVEWLRPEMLNRSRFWPRPGTEAAGMDGLFPSRVTKDRSRLLDELWWRVNVDVNRGWVGWEGDVMLDKVGHSGFKEGRTPTYKAVVLKTRKRLGSVIRVRVTEAAKGYLIGEEA